MTQEATNKACSCKTIPPMRKLSLIEIGVASEERRVANIPQRDNEVLVSNALPEPVASHLADRDARRLDQPALAVEDVFIENGQAGTRSNTYSGAAYWPE